jgi:hypothetical protein
MSAASIRVAQRMYKMGSMDSGDEWIPDSEFTRGRVLGPTERPIFCTRMNLMPPTIPCIVYGLAVAVRFL